ncbi:hypothetical protein N0V88_005290 [Collariella sp. IMI 366227]|nr:hypothetical protein N0V88_005290 [Collariella sp. IMI 366227]
MPEQTTKTTTAHSATQPERTTANSEVPRATGAGANTGAGVTRPKTEAEIEADKKYEEAMEDEYAKLIILNQTQLEEQV